MGEEDLNDLGTFDIDRALMKSVVKPQVPVVQQNPSGRNIQSETRQDFSAFGGGIVTQKTFIKEEAVITVQEPIRVNPSVAPQAQPEPAPKAAPKPAATTTNVTFDGVNLVPLEINAPIKASYSTEKTEEVAKAPVPEKPKAASKKSTPVTKKASKASSSDLEEAEPIKDVMILRPVLRDVHSLVHHATLAVFDKGTMGYDAQTGDAVISHSRNMLADRFMESNYEWALWWDDDVVPPIGNAAWSKTNLQSMPTSYPDKFLNINPIRRLQTHGKTIIGGLYFGRKRPWTPICERKTDTVSAFKNVPRAEIRPVGWVGTGFLLVHRSVFEDMRERFKGLAPKSGAVNPYEKVWDFFKPDRDQAEDVSFCKRAAECGHQPYVDLSVVCAHVGDYCFGPWNNQ